MDLIEDFAFRLPVEVICDMLGVPAGDRAPFRRYSLAILGALEPVTGPERLAAGNAAVSEFSAYLDGLVAERRKRPADDRDVLGTLIHGEVDGERLSHEELVQNCIFLLNAGHETTTNLIGNTVDALLRFPGELRRLGESPGLIRSCVEEGLRFESSNQLGNRRLTTDLEIGGENGRGRHLHPYRHRRGQSRPGAVRRARPLRCGSRAQPPLRLRLGRAHVPRCRSGTHGRHHRHRPSGRAPGRAARAMATTNAAAAPASAASTAIRSPGTARAVSP